MREIICNNGKQCLVDDDWYEELLKHSWYYLKGYAVTQIDRKTFTMQRMVFGFEYKEGYAIHHENENKLDNRRDNLKQMPSGLHTVLHSIKRERAGIREKKHFQYRGETLFS